jgi:3-methyladenine DNA glycosylase AlkD
MREQLVNEIRAYCESHADASKSQKWARYFKEGYDSWGLLDKDDPLWTTKDKEWMERYSKLGLAGFLGVGEDLFKSGKYEEGGLAIRFVKPFREKIDSKALKGLAKWFEGGIRNWGHTDVLCGEVIAPAVANGQLKLKDLESWRASKWKYQRRAAAVALLNYAKAGGEVLEFVRPLMADEERVVHQGTGWLLREAWKKQPKAVEKFLLEHKESAPRTIVQYATEKMSAEQKARFKRSKKST